MLISDEHKFIFIHNVKTGGSSLRFTLAPVANLEWRYEGLYIVIGKDNKRGYSAHAPANYVRDEEPERFANYFKFAFVRNPWDWCASLYAWHTSKAKGSPLYEDMKGRTFLQYLKAMESVEKKTDNQYSCFHQHDYVLDNDGSVLVDFIGRFERLQEDFDHIMDHLGLVRTPLMHENSNEHPDYKEVYDDETRDFVARFHAKDIELFGYEFEGRKK